MFLQTSNMLEVSFMIRLGLGTKTTWLVFSYRVSLFWLTCSFATNTAGKCSNISPKISSGSTQINTTQLSHCQPSPPSTQLLKRKSPSVLLWILPTLPTTSLSNSWERGRQLIILNLIMFNMSVSGHVSKPCSNPLVTFNLFYSLNVAWVLSSAGLRCLRWLTGHLRKTPIKKTSPRRSSAPLLLPALSILIIPFFGWLAIVSLSNRSVIW